MLNQAWINKIMACDLDSPDIVGPNRDEEDDKKDAWALRYIARFVEKGIHLSFAIQEYAANENRDYEQDPSDAADEEMSYWDEG